MTLVAVLHDIRSAHNTASIFRTADGAGFSKIYCCGVTPAPLDRFGKIRPDFAKVALGAEKELPWEHVRSTVRVLKKLKADGWKIYAVEQAKGSVPYYSVASTNHFVILSVCEAPSRGGSASGGCGNDKRIPRRARNDKVAIVVGNEVKGLPSRILALADKVIDIPMYGAKESLNVSVAFGIVAYHLAMVC